MISDSSFNQYCFEVYYALYNALGYNKQQRDDVKDPYIYHLDESIQNFSVNVTEEMTSALRKYFKNNEKNSKEKVLRKSLTALWSRLRMNQNVLLKV